MPKKKKTDSVGTAGETQTGSEAGRVATYPRQHPRHTMAVWERVLHVKNYPTNASKDAKARGGQLTEVLCSALCLQLQHEVRHC